MIDSILKTFVRNIVPGFVFVVFCLFIPASVLDIQSLNFIFQSDVLVLVGVVVGFILDGFGGYRYTMFFRAYRQSKIRLVERLKQVEGSEVTSMDPDVHIANLWRREPNIYDRLLEERAEWVSILNSAFCFLLASIGAILIFVYYTANGTLSQCISALTYFVFCSFLSYKMADTGTRRMKAHDEKMVQSIRAVAQKFGNV